MHLINIASMGSYGLTKNTMQDIIRGEKPLDLSSNTTPTDVKWNKNILLHGTLVVVTAEANRSIFPTVLISKDCRKLSQCCGLNNSLCHPGDSLSLVLGKVNGGIELSNKQ